MLSKFCQFSIFFISKEHWQNENVHSTFSVLNNNVIRLLHLWFYLYRTLFVRSLRHYATRIVYVYRYCTYIVIIMHAGVLSY